MASSLISNSHHIDFESVFRLDDASMVQMFESLIAKGLKKFLGCPAVFYEDALTEFFANSSVREDGMVVCTIGGTAIEISREMFAAAFELPTEGLIDLTDVSKNFVFDARSLFSDSKEQISMSCLKKALKFHFRLLHDILAKTIYVKAGSFDSITRDRFLLMTAITFDAKGYAIQICVLLRNVPGLELGESKSFPVPRILNEKTVHRFVSVNENVGIKEVADAPRARRTPVKTTVSKKRPATGDDEVAPIIKKKRTTKGKPVALASWASTLTIGNLGVERLPDYFLDDFEEGVNTDYFVEFLRGSSGQSDSEFDSASSSGDTVYRSPSPPDYAYALGPPILSPTVQEERLYFVQSPDSSPVASPQLESSSSSSSDVSLHFDSADLPVHDHANTQASAPVDSNVFTNALEDLRSYISQRIHESTCEIRSKSTQMNDLKKGLVAPVGTIFQDLFDIKKNQRAQEAKLNALDGQVAAIRNEQLEFQNKISADLLCLSTQFAEIVDYIRGGDAKKGEGGSSSHPPPVRVERRPLPTPQSPRDAVRIPTFPRTTGTSVERAEQARRHILESGQAITLEEAAERVRQADIQESDRVQRER
ncbi:hypothetical protein F511_28146 [Dorcoceras hygrometricum]|uniref:Dystroglycan-like n=1 Tax=Dorcoceras hygrometricum TaxID=472368 RepID=A0A2Z7CSR4_9LAMI|nr:hypothetical protein F511_28146 [Dorcoceras hygrometricum]